MLKFLLPYFNLKVDLMTLKHKPIEQDFYSVRYSMMIIKKSPSRTIITLKLIMLQLIINKDIIIIIIIIKYILYMNNVNKDIFLLQLIDIDVVIW